MLHHRPAWPHQMQAAGRARSGRSQQAEAQQTKIEARLKKAKAAAKQQDVTREAVGEHLCFEYGKKQKPAPESLKNRLAKACRCSRSLAEGRRKDTCDLRPTRLRYLMRQNVEARACIAKQLASNTTLSKAQRAAALEHIFGSDVFVAGPPPAARHPRAFWPQIFFQVRFLLWGYVSCYVSGYV